MSVRSRTSPSDHRHTEALQLQRGAGAARDAGGPNAVRLIHHVDT